MSKNITTEEAVTKLCEALKKDPEYYNSWKANIAMSFVDEFYRTYPDNELVEVKNIANTAADNFLRLLISK
jgi:CRISPR/Cas system-associated protein Cas10 (large subunit of type III CRISPR-Cas system)